MNLDPLGQSAEMPLHGVERRLIDQWRNVHHNHFLGQIHLARLATFVELVTAHLGGARQICGLDEQMHVADRTI
jgi:hypothetical protein